MKVYWAGIFSNRYIQSLQEALQDEGIEVVCAQQDFLKLKIPGGVPIHMHWPESYLDLKKGKRELFQALHFYFGRNPLSLSLHNLQPHWNDLERGRAFYESILKFISHLFHLGSPSIELFERAYPSIRNCQHHLCPHHILPYTLQPEVSPPWSSETRSWISIGRIRTWSDRYMMRKYYLDSRGQWDRLYVHRYTHLIQRNPAPGWSNHPKLIATEIQLRWLDSRVKLNAGDLSVDEMSSWLSHADRLLLPRSQHLNSGVIFQATPFQIPIRVPEVGNISWQLKQLGYLRTENDWWVPEQAIDFQDYSVRAVQSLVKAYKKM